MASNGCTALRHGDSCHGVIGLPACVCCEAVRVAKNKLPTADLSATPSQRGEQRRAEWRLTSEYYGGAISWLGFASLIWKALFERELPLAVFVCARFMACEVVKAIACHSESHASPALFARSQMKAAAGSGAALSAPRSFALHHLSVKSSECVWWWWWGEQGGGAVIPHFLHEGYSIHFSDSVDGLQFKS